MSLSSHSSPSSSARSTQRSSTSKLTTKTPLSHEKPLKVPSEAQITSPNALYRKFWSIIQPYLFHLPFVTVSLTQHSPQLTKAHVKSIITIYETIYKNENRDAMTQIELMVPKEVLLDDLKLHATLKDWRVRYVRCIEKMLEKRLEKYDARFEKVSSMTPTLEEIFASVEEFVEKKFSKESVLALFKNITLREKKIEEIDERFVREFDEFVQKLNLTGNKLRALPSKLPKSLSILNLGANQLTDSSLKAFATQGHKNLQHLGLSFNSLRTCEFFVDQQADKAAEKFPNLMSLDLSYNNISDVDRIIASLRGLSNLQLLFLNGNPLSLYQHYRARIITGLPHLLVLGDQDISDEERENAEEQLLEAEAAKRHAQEAYEQAKNAPPPEDGVTTGETTEPAVQQSHPPPSPISAYIQFLLRKLSGVELIGTPPREEDPKKGKKPEKKKPAKKGVAVEEEPPEYDKIVEYQAVLRFMGEVRTEWMREKEILDLNISEVIEGHITDERFYSALRLPVPCQMYRRSKEVLVTNEPEPAAGEEIPESAPPRVKNEIVEFVGEACMDLSGFMEYPRTTNVDVVSTIKDISKQDEPEVGRMTLRGEVNLLWDRPVEVVQEEVIPEDPKKGKKAPAKKGAKK